MSRFEGFIRVKEEVETISHEAETLEEFFSYLVMQCLEGCIMPSEIDSAQWHENTPWGPKFPDEQNLVQVFRRKLREVMVKERRHLMEKINEC